MAKRLELIGSARTCRIDACGAIVETDSARVEVRLIASDLVRVEMDPVSPQRAGAGAEATRPRRSYAATKLSWPQVAATIEDRPEAVWLRTDAVLVRVAKTPVRIDFLRPDGTPICMESPRYGMGWRGTGAGCTKILDAADHFYGFGERTGFLDKRGSAMTLWNTDANPHTPSTDSMYVSIPFFMRISRQGTYGVFLDSAARCFFDMGKSSRDEYLFATDEKTFCFYFFAGPDAKGVLRRYTELTGRMSLPPLWALGYHQSRFSYHAQQQVEEVASCFRRSGIPCDAIYLDIHYMHGFRVFTFDPEEFKDAPELMKRLAAMGFKVVAIVDPGVKVDPDYKVYREGVSRDCFVKLPGGKVFVASVWPGPVSFPDFTREDVRTWWAVQHRALFDAGVRGIWNDMNEPSCFDTPTKTMPGQALHGEPGEEVPHAQVHNAYANFMSEATSQAFRELLPGVRPFVISRAGHAGIQRHACIWTGDNSSWWEHLMMAVPMCLNLGMSGVSFVGTDVGGFSGDSDPELVARWTQLGTFTPFFRNHSSLGSRPQEPYSLGEPYTSICRDHIRLRYRLLPYIYTLMRESTQEGIPAMRAMVLEFPEDDKARAAFDQFMLGRDILVAPVYHPGSSCRKVYLPQGEWVDFHTGEKVRGGRCVIADAPLERIPLFYREGAIVPYGREMNFVGEVPQALELVDVYPSVRVPERAFEMYVDDGETTDYMSGAFGFVEIRYELTMAEEGLPGRPGGAGRGSGRVLRVAVNACDERYPCTLPLGVIRLWGCDTPPSHVILDAEALPEARNMSEVLGGKRGYFTDAARHHLYVGVHGIADDMQLKAVWPEVLRGEG
ncbi:MAG: glycoside hydrolase family 31 protein [Clostridia bacterium]